MTHDHVTAVSRLRTLCVRLEIPEHREQQDDGCCRLSKDALGVYVEARLLSELRNVLAGVGMYGWMLGVP